MMRQWLEANNDLAQVVYDTNKTDAGERHQEQ